MSQWLATSDGSKLRSGKSDFPWRTAVLSMRLFEAHFLPIHLFLTIVASAIYTGLPREPSWYLKTTLELTALLRTAGFALMTMYFVLVYEGYHRTCLTVREHEIRRAGLYHQSDFAYRSRWSISSILDYVAFPVAGFIYGSFPLLQAMVSHFWTDNLTYLVSAKPVRLIAGEVGIAREIAGADEERQEVDHVSGK